MNKCVYIVGLLGLVSLVSACSKKGEEVVTATTVVEETTEGQMASKDEFESRDLTDNNSGVANPYNSYKRVFSDTVEDDNLDDLPEDVRNEVIKRKGQQSKTYEELRKEYLGDSYDVVAEYERASELTDELYAKMKEMNLHTVYDFDEDGLTDYEEMEVYHTDPNKKSTSGDNYTDKYKVDNDMDLFTKYDVDWVKVDDILTYKSDNYYGLEDYEIDNNFVEYAGIVEVLYLDMQFMGQVRYKSALSIPVEDLVVEVYNSYDATHAVIDYTVVDGALEWTVDEGYDKYIIRPKDVEIDLEKYK